MFKSKFANALTMMMIGALGMASAQNKLSVGYGAEADDMDPTVAKMCGRYCANSMIITRNAESREILEEARRAHRTGNGYGVDIRAARRLWAKSVGGKQLGRRDAGAGCLPDSSFLVAGESIAGKGGRGTLTGAYQRQPLPQHLLSYAGADSGCGLQALSGRVAGAMDAFAASELFSRSCGNGAAGRAACERLAERLGGAPVFTSDSFDMYQLVSVLRCASRLYRRAIMRSSRPCLPVPSAGVTMDERIRNLMHDRGQVPAAEGGRPELEEKLVATLATLDRDEERIRDGILRTVPKI